MTPTALFKVASWNVNSVRARKERLLAWLAKNQPDVLCLQEIKTEEANFPADELLAAGYQAAVFGQKTYNGVALLSRHNISEIRRGMPAGSDNQARIIAAVVQNICVVSAYVPNGALPTSEKYTYKKEWLARFGSYLEELLAKGRPLVVAGDFNIALEERDVSSSQEWQGTVLFNEEMTSALQVIIQSGLVDTLRQHSSAPGLYTWWDYRQGSFRRDRGLRLDYILASQQLAEGCLTAGIDRDERAGDKPSDHAPVEAVFQLPKSSAG